jgi:hypothetical protein
MSMASAVNERPELEGLDHLAGVALITDLDGRMANDRRRFGVLQVNRARPVTDLAAGVF